MESLKPDSFKRRDVERQLRELSAFRNDVWKKSGEFENLKTLGETFLGACDVDKEIVKQELAALKSRWDKVNNGTNILSLIAILKILLLLLLLLLLLCLSF